MPQVPDPPSARSGRPGRAPRASRTRCRSPTPTCPAVVARCRSRRPGPGARPVIPADPVARRVAPTGAGPDTGPCRVAPPPRDSQGGGQAGRAALTIHDAGARRPGTIRTRKVGRRAPPPIRKSRAGGPAVSSPGGRAAHGRGLYRNRLHGPIQRVGPAPANPGMSRLRRFCRSVAVDGPVTGNSTAPGRGVATRRRSGSPPLSYRRPVMKGQVPRVPGFSSTPCLCLTSVLP